jgi:hypothetical protein
LQFRGTWSAGPSDDQARFLADLRALRDCAAIGYDELAARAHYPSDILKEAENGPSLPGLPILTAYVRACEGDVLDWEERWRRLNPEVADDPNLPVRPAGASAAAVAGARAGIGIAPPDVYDPDRIRAALRGDQARTEPGGRRTNDPGGSALDSADSGSSGQILRGDSGASPDNGPGWGASSGWDTAADPGVTSANGNHLATHGSRRPFDAAFTQAPDSAERSDSAQAEEFSWLKKNAPASRPAESEAAWPEQADTGRPEPANSWFEQSRPAEQADREVGWSAGQTEAGPAAEPTDSGFAWLERADSGLVSRPEAESARVQAESARVQAEPAPAAPERTDFWSKPVPPAPADLQPPAALRRAEEPTIARASWPTPGASATTPAAAAEPGQRAAADTGAAAAAQPLRSAGSAARTSAAQPDNRRQDRYFPVRLLVVIVIAALIGSALVLLLK